MFTAGTTTLEAAMTPPRKKTMILGLLYFLMI
jgi:hypothetical protein